MVALTWKIIIAALALALISIADSEGRKPYEDSQDDEDDSLDCNDGRKIEDPILLPFFEKLRQQEMIPSRMKEWIIFFDGEENEGLSIFGEDWNEAYLTENGLSKDNQGLPFGRVFYTNAKNVYMPRIKPIFDEWEEFRVMYAEQLLLDAMERVKIYIRYNPGQNSGPQSLSRSATRMLQKLMKRSDVAKVYLVGSPACDVKCDKAVRMRDNPMIALAMCGSAFGKTLMVECKEPAVEIFEGSEAGRYKNINEPEFQVELPNNLKQELHKIMDWLLNRIAQRMKNYMEMAFSKNRFRKSPTDLFNKVNLQISKIRGGQTFEASKSAHLIYNSLFDLNVYLNVTNTPYTFDKFASLIEYFDFIGRFSKWQLDTTKYANFFEPLKAICLQYIGNGAILMKSARNIFELEDGVYDLAGAICHENVLFIINGLTTMNTIKSGIYDNENCPFGTVFVLAKKNFTINEDLRIVGKNLVIFSPTWIIVKEQTIDLSGEAGKAGEEGASGGDFFAFGTKFERSQLLRVVSNGGDGGKGRDAEDPFDQEFSRETEGDYCVSKETEKLISRHGATHGAPGGSPGEITLKFIRNQILNVTVVRGKGNKGKDGIIKDITVSCGNNSFVVPVRDLQKGNYTRKNIEKMKESEVLQLFGKVIRKNSRRLSYEVLAFYKDIWTWPPMGQTLDSTLRDFLNGSDYTKDSREFYDITSQILHAQIKYSCNMTEPQRILLDFALATIRMENPTEGFLPSVIDIDGYLREVSERVGTSEMSSEFFERKEAKFRKLIEEANNYLNVSLLPSLTETIGRVHEYLQTVSPTGTRGEDHFQESLVMNTLLRHLATIFEHVHLTLSEFVAPLEALEVGEMGSAALKRKLYFYRHVRNNITVNQMTAMEEFLKLLKEGVEEETLSEGNACKVCRQEVNKLLKELMAMQPDSIECNRIAEDLQGKQAMKKPLRFDALSCRECAGNCSSCGWCRSCQMVCRSCNNCDWCPWCAKCLKAEGRDYCSRCPDCRSCRPVKEVATNASVCSECNNCLRCPTCEKCDEDASEICDACRMSAGCDLCPKCPHCVSARDCLRCRDCAACPRCLRCVREERSCSLCSNCSQCPHCSQCKTYRKNHSLFSGVRLCKICPCFLCPSCPGCRLRPEFDEIDRDVFFGLGSRRVTQPTKRMNAPPPGLQVPPGGWLREELVRVLARYIRDGLSPSPLLTDYADGGMETDRERANFYPAFRSVENVWHKCLNSIGSYFDQMNGTCNAEMQSSCSTTLKAVRKMAGKKWEDEDANLKMSIRIKCTECNDTLDYFLEKLSAEVNNCKRDSNYNYREPKSLCSPNEGVLFRMNGCDPETFSRTYDEIRENFLKEFSSQFVSADEKLSDEVKSVPRNFVFLLTNVEMMLMEGLPLTTANMDNALQVTESLVKFKDLRREYEKKMTELHDYSETDIYDLFAAELSMQNERLDLTSKWLGQLKKLVPWIRKVTAFLATHLQFQDVSEKILEAVRLVSEIVHNIKVVEHYRNLRDYMNRVKSMDKIRARGVSNFKPVFERTFITDIFNKAVKISENWMFPLTRSLADLRSTLQEIKNESYSFRLNATAEEIENHRKAISLYTSTQLADSDRKVTMFYKWNIRTRPTLLDDLFAGKPIVLVSEILDGGKMNAVMGKNFQFKLVAGRRQKRGTQREIDEALRPSRLNVTHSGISYFKFGSRIYRRLTETFNFLQPAAPLNATPTPQNTDFVLSPYTTWILRLETEANRASPVKIKDKIGRIELYGTGRYVVNCADIPDVNQNFTPLVDYRRRNGK